MVEPYHPLYHNLQCLDGTGISDVKPDQPFHMLVANVGEDPVGLLPHNVVAYASHQPETIIESDITHAERLGLITEYVYKTFRKRHNDVQHIKTINKHLAAQREQRIKNLSQPRKLTWTSKVKRKTAYKTCSEISSACGRYN